MHQSRWYKSGWTDERRAKQREAIQRWKPWEKSTGPKTPKGKAQAALNVRWAYFTRKLSCMSTKELLKTIKRL